MKKLLFLALALPFIAAAQTELPRVIDDTLFTTTGFKAVAGTDIKLGVGTLPNGEFKYITESSASVMASFDANYRPAPVGRKWNGHLFHIKKFRKEGTKKRGYTYYLILGGGNLVNYECDIENAIASGELVVPEEFRPKAAQVVPATTPADELKKLKGLLDAGAINQNEYDSAKKKILAKM